MIIQQISRRDIDNRERLSAAFEWEECNQPTFHGFLESSQHEEGSLALTADTFLSAAWIPALRSGERRIKVEGLPVSPALEYGLQIVARTLQHWYPDRYPLTRPLPLIEAHRDEHIVRRERDAGFLFSGGVDSLSTLRANHLHFPKGHPQRFTTGLVIHGFQPEVDAIQPSVHESLVELAKDAGIRMRSITTNLRLLRDDWAFWVEEFAGSFLAAVSHSMREILHSMIIPPSTDFEWHLEPEGTHPMIDGWFSSHVFQVRHDDVTKNRFERTRLIADWSTALKHLRVCNHPEAASRWANCGHCDKCLMTMLPLLVLGKLSSCSAFPSNDVDVATLKKHLKINWLNHAYFSPLVPKLRRAGRTDLAEAIDGMLDDYHGDMRWRERKARVRKKLSDIDQALLRGKARKFFSTFHKDKRTQA